MPYDISTRPMGDETRLCIVESDRDGRGYQASWERTPSRDGFGQLEFRQYGAKNPTHHTSVTAIERGTKTTRQVMFSLDPRSACALRDFLVSIYGPGAST